MKDILWELADTARRRVDVERMNYPFQNVRWDALEKVVPNKFPFEDALKKDGMSFICEVKRASPSKGIIAEDFDPVKIAKEYEAAGTDCISVLTEPTKFLGSVSYLNDVSENVSVPTLRKDFVVDDYMIYQAKLYGASAVLLIASILNFDQLKAYIKVCESLGMSALVEVHDESEVKKAVKCGARIIGVNNRDLKDFSVDPENCLKLRPKVPKDIVFVAESGIKDHNDIAKLEAAGVDAVLIGETMMRAYDKTAMLRSLRYGE